MKFRYIWLFGLLVYMFALTACNQAQAEQTSASSTQTLPAEESPVSEVKSTDTPEAEEADTTVAASPTPLPAYPLNITFTSDDGTELIGHYWAPAVEDAPVIVLMHQYPLDHNSQWIAIAPWLQNRGLTAAVRTGGEPFTDPSWFTPMFEGFNFAVFSFTFRNCLGGCKEDSVETREEWIIDAVSAIKAAASFTSVDPQKVIVLGTSIGADAAVDACARLLDAGGVQCMAVVAISPDSWLEVDYTETVTALNEAGIPVRCLASELDGNTAETCQSFEGDQYIAMIDPGEAHGVRMFNPALELDVPTLVVQWLIDWTLVE